jgi:L-amino acid N-acyltransferase YncA
MKIAPATISHLSAITEIYNEAITERTACCDLEPRSLENRTEWFKQFDSRHPIFVGTGGGSVCAYGCLMAYSPKPGYRFSAEHSVYVARSARGRGHGKTMLTHLIAEARRLEYHYLEGGIFAHNATSLALHKSLGFREMGTKREVASLDGRWADVVILARLL